MQVRKVFRPQGPHRLRIRQKVAEGPGTVTSLNGLPDLGRGHHAHQSSLVHNWPGIGSRASDSLDSVAQPVFGGKGVGRLLEGVSYQQNPLVPAASRRQVDAVLML